MTGTKFETDFCELLKASGYWALNIPRNKRGAQPFDVLAIHGVYILAVDCKVCGKDTFNLERIEDNQWAAFQLMNDRTGADVGIMAYYNGDIYYLEYRLLLDCLDAGVKSIKLSKLNPFWRKEDIKHTLGRYFE